MPIFLSPPDRVPSRGDQWKKFSDKELKKILGRIRKWGKEFSKSEYAGRLGDVAKDESQFVLETFAEYMYSYHASPPEGWDEADLEECCLETLPRKISAGDAYFKSITPVLSAFFAFAEEKKLLKNAPNLAQKVQAISKQIEKHASDPRNWGPAKSLVMAAQESGVDVTNQKEMNRFITLYNERHLSERTIDDLPSRAEPVHVGPKIGRNEPCPCGSGKKYKKCCGR